jgi:hypothetical protein
MRGATFPLREAADEFGAAVERLGWELAFAALGDDDGALLRRSMTLDRLREIALESDSSDWHMPDFLGSSAVLKADLSVAITWERDANAERPDDDAYPCYAGLMRGAEMVRVFYNGQPVLQETLLTLHIDKTRRRREEVLFVPRAHLSRRRWYADVLPYALAGLVNALCWRFSYEWYMEASGVRPSD